MMRKKRSPPDTTEMHEVRTHQGSYPSPPTKTVQSSLRSGKLCMQVIAFPAQTDSEASLSTAAFHRPDHAAVMGTGMGRFETIDPNLLR
jgi:hypothetical protein